MKGAGARVDSVDPIEDLIVVGSEAFFDEADIRETLHASITSDFYDFLVKFGEKPAAQEIDYLVGTIRSGMEEFFALAYLCRAIHTATRPGTLIRTCIGIFLHCGKRSCAVSNI
jgi:hypothetical protein